MSDSMSDEEFEELNQVAEDIAGSISDDDDDDYDIDWVGLGKFVAETCDMEADQVTVDLREMRETNAELADFAAMNADSLIEIATGEVQPTKHSERPKTDQEIKIIGSDEDRWSIGESPQDRLGDVVVVEAQIAARKGRTSVHPELNWVCQRCGTANYTQTTDDWLKESPVQCAGCSKEGPFRLDKDQTTWDYREVELEELPDQAEVDGDPESIRGEAVRESIVDEVSVPTGERVRITGVLRTEEELEDKETPHYIDIRHCERLDDDGTVGELTDEDWEVIREIISDSNRSLLEEIGETVHPSASRADGLHGGILSIVGSPDGEQSGSRVRGDIHAMFVGDSGAGKSTLIDALTEITPKFAKTAGGTSSSVGLTASAVQDGIGMTDSGWVLRPGLLPRAHNGVLFLNEFDDVDSDARKALNEALESGQVEVSKAGMSATFPAHTSLITSANPKYGDFRTDTEEPLADQLQFSKPMLSRMDLIFPFVSEADWSSDMEMADNLLAGHADDDATESTASDTDLTVDLIRRYISHVRDSVHPTIDQDSTAAEKLKQKYSKIREHGSGRGVPISPRTFQALARLSRAHARLRGGDVVTEEDADVAISLVESSLTQLDVLPDSVRSDDVESLTAAAARAAVSSPSMTQQQRREWIVETVEEMNDDGRETTRSNVFAVALVGDNDAEMSEDVFRDEWDSLLNNGTLVLDGDGEAEVFR